MELLGFPHHGKFVIITPNLVCGSIMKAVLEFLRNLWECMREFGRFRCHEFSW
jgi:hypothetical protein